jgi:DNA-binding NtrC family response regulator
MKTSPAIDNTLTSNAVVLSISPDEEDHGLPQRIFRESQWSLIASPTIASSVSVLREAPIPVVVCERDLSPGTWREMLQQTLLLPDPPFLVVTSRLADERLWAEALSLGAYDVLAKPFYAPEVTRILGLAWQHWRERHKLHARPTMVAGMN